MEARVLRVVVLLAALTSVAASYRTTNFIVSAPSDRLAQKIGDAAEDYRRELAIAWLGKELPRWRTPCPITAHVAPDLGAGGVTSFVFDGGQVGQWRMVIQGSELRTLDSVLPHEVTHTIFATHFRQPLPRWADEGACTTVEHTSEKLRHQKMLISFLQTRRGIAFSDMLAMDEYPRDVLPLYAQGYSLARFLIQHGGRQKFVAFVGDGLRDKNWMRALNASYGYNDLALLQDIWLDWVKKGSPTLVPKSPASRPPATLVAISDNKRSRPSPNLIHRVGSVQPRRSVAAVAPSPSTKAAAPIRRGWYAAGERSDRSEPQFSPGSIAESRSRAQEHQAVRQQPIQQPKQTVLR